MICMIIHK